MPRFDLTDGQLANPDNHARGDAAKRTIRHILTIPLDARQFTKQHADWLPAVHRQQRCNLGTLAIFLPIYTQGAILIFDLPVTSGDRHGVGYHP